MLRRGAGGHRGFATLLEFRARAAPFGSGSAVLSRTPNWPPLPCRLDVNYVQRDITRWLLIWPREALGRCSSKDRTVKRAKLTVLRIARAVGGFWLARRLTGRGVRILCYHGTWRTTDTDGFVGDAMFMNPGTFRRRLAAIRRLNYPVVPLADAVRALRGETTTLPPASVAITIDDGWYGTYADMLPILRQYAMPATLYCDSASVQTGRPVPHVMANWLRRSAGWTAPPDAAARDYAAATDISASLQLRLEELERFTAAAGIDQSPYLSARAFGYMMPEELRDSVNAGLDVQLHTHHHTLHDLSRSAITAETVANRQALTEMLHDTTPALEHFSYPNGICSTEAAKVLEDIGMRSATTTRQGIAWPGSNPYLLPRLLDGEQLTDIEFEAELSGFADLLRGVRGFLLIMRDHLRPTTGT
jgi:peptidoglycan/xylan/chitin deacetylase (PgdA/CDA1 family)